MRLRYYAHYGSIGGYGRAARDYLLALHNFAPDVELEIACLDHRLTSPEGGYAELDRYVVPLTDVVGTPDVAIYHATPRVLETLTRERDLEDAPTRAVALTTWETSVLPRIYADVLNRFHAVIAPSGFCRDIFLEALTNPEHPELAEFGATRLVHLVPHCFDEEYWEPLNPKRWQQGRRFRFYTIGAWGERKNTLGLIKAFLHAFSTDGQVQMPVELGIFLDESANLDDVRALVACSGIGRDDLPKIEIRTTRRSEFEILAIHTEGDCFVSATRGEGFGLGMFEAAIMKRHVIAPLWGGQMDFLDGYPGHRNVPFQLTPCFGSEDRDRVVENNGHRMQISKVTIPPGVDCRQLWADPDLNVLARQMRQVYQEGQRPEFYNSDNWTARAGLEARFGYRVVGPQLANTLRGIAWQTSSSTSSVT